MSDETKRREEVRRSLISNHHCLGRKVTVYSEALRVIDALARERDALLRTIKIVRDESLAFSRAQGDRNRRLRNELERAEAKLERVRVAAADLDEHGHLCTSVDPDRDAPCDCCMDDFRAALADED